MNPGRRVLAFALVPLSAIPFVAVVPHVAPAIERRMQELRAPARPAAEPPVPLRRLTPTWPGRLR